MMSPARKEPDSETYSGRFAVRLRTLREKAGLTVQEVAEKLGISDVSYYALEKGSPTVRLEFLPIIAETLQLKSVKSLFPEK